MVKSVTWRDPSFKQQSIFVKMPSEGLSVPMVVLLLAGETAGLGVLALPYSMIGTGPAGFFLVIYFTFSAIFVGQRLGLCWTMIERMFPEYRNEVGSRQSKISIS